MSKQTRSVGATPGKVFAYSAAAGALACAAYFTYEYAQGRKTAQEDGSEDVYLPPYDSGNSSSTRLPSTSNWRGDEFPLRKGSSGARVSQLQEALSKLVGSTVMNKHTGIDGKFGAGTEAVLKLAGFPTVIDEVTFSNIISKPGTSSISSPDKTALQLHQYVTGKNLQGVLTILRQMRSTADYTAVNEPYKNMRYNVVRTTIVTDLLQNAFPGNTEALGLIKAEFFRIGLKYNGDSGKWSLSGLMGIRDIVTCCDTVLVDHSQNRIRVRRNTILGEELQSRNGITYFKSIDNYVAAVPTAHINYL